MARQRQAASPPAQTATDFATDPDVIASALLTFGSPIWKFISNVSNVDFLLSINEQKFAVMFDFLENIGWFLIILIGGGWLFIRFLHRDQRKQRPSPSW